MGRVKKPSIMICVSPSSKRSVVVPRNVTFTVPPFGSSSLDFKKCWRYWSMPVGMAGGCPAATATIERGKHKARIS